MKQQNVLEIKELCVQVDGKELLHNINLTIPSGEVHAIFGLNGSGKTSLMMAIMGYAKYEITNGQILFEGKDIVDLDITERSRLGISIAQQRPPTISGVKLRDVINYTAANNSRKSSEIDEIIKAAHMENLIDRDINKGLSGGEIKRSELLQLLVLQPKFSMLDEPDSGVDVESLGLVGELINMLFSSNSIRLAKRKAGIIITHSGNMLNYINIDKAHVMLNGRIGCTGNPHIILDRISKCGYEECIRCIQEGA